MKPIIYLPFMLVAVLVANVNARTENKKTDLSNRDAIAGFIENNLIGRTLHYTFEGKISEDTMFTLFERKKTFTDLHRSERGLSFTTYMVIEQKTWDLNAEGERENPDHPKSKNRVLSTKLQAVQRKSTGELVGFELIDGNSLGDSSATASSTRMKLIKRKDGTPALRVDQRDVGYEDHFAKGGAHEPGVTHTTIEYFVKDDKLTANYTYRAFRVDPETLEKAEGASVRVEESIETETK